ncbi:MAG: 16S rRNA (guanine(527)-N(7))-methyltransferase RsmG [Deltaproteobacteria bacterium]|jgi:16S rRNA (guanine527-N7)-methyltransferase|nr:16S rRNA (guanine(527)-N(7))-methyltransferase RsmG [Deltaproteobacteria bacterium]
MSKNFKSDEVIHSEFLKSGIKLTQKELRQFVLLDTLLRNNKDELDLTRIDDRLNIINKHYVDSALAAELIEAGEIIMDLGSGAGFPGLPMAIRRPDWQFILAEPRYKRLKFIEEAVNLLGLPNVSLYPHKVTIHFDRPLTSIISRDFQSVAKTIILAENILPTGGKLFLMKGGKVESELKEAKRLKEWKSFTFLKDSLYKLGGIGLSRHLLSFEKTGTNDTDHKNLKFYSSSNITEIASTVNSRYKGWIKLLEGRQIKKSGETLIFGPKIIKDMLVKCPHVIRGIIARKEEELKHLKFSKNTPIFLLRPEIFSRLDVFGTGPPVLLGEASELPNWEPSLELNAITLFVPFQDPQNVGSVIRTAAAMGAFVVLLAEAANPYHPKAMRVAGPSVYQTQLYQGPSLAELATLKLPYIHALSARGTDIYSFNPSMPLGLVMGLEGPGLDNLFPDEKRLSIPMKGEVESLNAAVAAAMALAILTPKFRT